MRLTSAATALALLAAPLAAQEVARRTQGSATLENVPPVPASVSAAVQRYGNSRSAGVADWTQDGQLLITTRFGATAQLHRVAMPMGARTQLTFYGEPIGAARAVPGSDRILFGRDTGGDEWFQLYSMAPGGETLQLTEPGTRNTGVAFARDGGTVYWAQSKRGSADYAIQAANPADPASRRTVFARAAIGSIAPSDVSSDGTKLLLTRAPSNVAQELHVLDLATGTLTEVFRGPPAIMADARFARGGRSVLAITNRGSDVRRLVEIDVATGRATPVSPAGRWDAESFELSDDGRLLAWTTNEDGYSKLTVQDFLTRRALPQPELPVGVVGGLRFDRAGRRLGFSLSSPNAPGDAWSWDVAEGRLTRWTQSETGGLDPARLPTPKLVRFNSFDGLSVPAFVYRPTTAAPGAKTPVLINIHGGPEAQARPGWSSGIAYFADVLGATVIVPNVRGSDGYGKRYLDMDNGPKREDSVKDIGALLDWVARQPDLDASRVAVYGGSYGGYMVLAAMTHYSDRLAGGVDAFGVSDWTTFLQNTEAYRRDNRRAEYGDERTPEMQRVFARISPRAHVARITKPMLVEQGANDPRVPRSESEQMVAALRSRGVPVSYLLFADEGHGWRKKPNQDLSREVETVFLQRLFGAPAQAAESPKATADATKAADRAPGGSGR
jgi:dipeptidyl aminopeptidase/acylaminoacyl peptidase